MSSAVIVGFKRSPFTISRKGGLAEVRPEDILSQVINDLVKSSNINKDDIEDIIAGCAYPEGEQGYNIAKIVTFMTGMPEHVAGMTVNRWCGSSMQTIHNAAGAIAMSAGNVFICCGIESMTKVPINGLNYSPHPDLNHSNPNVYLSMGDTAENVAKKYNLSREIQQDFAISSHQKASYAEMNNNFTDEITKIKTKGLIVEKDGAIRPNTSQEILNSLKLVFDKKGTITAGTASPFTDGASATLICNEEYAKKNNLDILAKVVSTSVQGCPPELMGLGPIGASKKALKRANLTIEDIDVVELNEAFASQSLACIKDLNIDPQKVNIDGGAIALGHPLGATGARITAKAAQILKREKKKYALATQCIGLGQGIATILESY
ncbi:MAG: thiolase family protein [Alphaproteobacteria bacterium]|jgi:acetyl-CoA acyltransferase|uniref:Thiolase N-terminal domain-containing protein n=1 Tax=marine metagenome TaxID=408172 RepID=A0A381VUQ4_9ZZZZ|nr:thiolase family protein [Alphaproteobacteria bacterium]MCH2544228.1 thiolase family protein [Alphaproteobacteria bacterium]|tara:strand:+ start:737 stop:1873 length:1137 start_codon:yes stop_codon:yes gene_type:complete